MSKQPVILAILDGWGEGQQNETNPIYVAEPKNFDYLRANFPNGLLQASGISVGLPWGEEGNSEVGHLNLGAGRIIYQYLPKIDLAIRDGSFFKNPALKSAFGHAKKNNSSVNLVGLMSDGNVHSSFDHIKALVEFAAKENVSKINFHLFTDGRDSAPTSSIDLLANLPKEANLASISGRFYGMDREGYWDRTQKAYSVIVGEGQINADAKAYIKNSYANKKTDEFIEPTRVKESCEVKDNDAMIFFNFREDRIRQMASVFADRNFQKFPVKKFNNLFVATMTPYDKNISAVVVFPNEPIANCLGKVLADKGKNQIRITETQKYPHITYFFNGLEEKLFLNEYRVLIPSRPIARQDTHPEMMAAEIASRAVESIMEDAFDFVLLNFANPDIIAHTGNYDACVKAVKTIDEQIGKIIKTVLETDATLIITSDHGNMEKVVDEKTGNIETKHNASPVPIYLVAKKFMRPRTEEEILRSKKENIGILADVAPTILELMNIPQPAEMTGQSLLKFLQ
ncbi:MAG: 2,3-bisphosphoglycerate-independent phosphoglycerate mutase [Spirochaetia bacterium]|nr:MAG: 2,3-bisphosphoglycerate-independent phosphoglycerate mutase [Spirochaetia bacterium]